jgi:predicted DNA-binding WGR domain protein
MPRLVCREGKSRKLWHGWVDGLELNVRFGPLGKPGTEQRKTFDSNEKAKKELEKLIKQKLAKGYADETRTFTFDESGLEIRELVDPPLPVLSDASLAYEEAGLKGGWSDTFWHGDYAFALDRRDEKAHGGLVDRTGRETRFRKFDPALVGASFQGDFDESSERVCVGSANGPAYLVDVQSFATREIVPAGDEVIALTPVRDGAALLRKNDGKTRLEIWKNEKLEHTIACGRQNMLFAFGGGRALMIGWLKQNDSWDGKSWPSTHFVAIDGAPRLLGTNGMSTSYAYVKDGRAIYVSDTFGMLEITNIDAALEKGKPIKTLT